MTSLLVTLHVLLATTAGWLGPDGPGWVLPVGPEHGPPRVLTGFDPPALPWLPGHRGVDLAAAAGEPVRAAGDGVVAFAGPVAGRGVISLRHPGGVVTTYEPVRAEVGAGAVVRAGRIIGTVSPATVVHRSCPQTCLHWGARRDGRYIDPLSLVAPRPVRLLPGPPRVLPWASGPRVGLPVGRAQPVDRHVGVALGGGDRGVAEQFLYRAQVGTAGEEVGRR